MPWLHSARYSQNRPGRGRDRIWGLTRELDFRGPLHPDGWPKVLGRDCMGQDWGIGYFNEPGGYTIGQVFPEGSAVHPERATFPKGTVSFKILFTSVLPSRLREIEGAWTINAYINASGNCITSDADEQRRVTAMRHVHWTL
jgi:hypothetical protein